MKVLLLDSALGMTSAKEWKGRYDANVGYLVVKKDGDIVCYHFYNRNDVEDYLYHNTRFERASRSRYHFGSLYRDNDGKVYIKLNLQIRFTKQLPECGEKYLVFPDCQLPLSDVLLSEAHG